MDTRVTRLDAIFSQFIRLTYASHEGYVRCYTCTTVKHWSEMQNGHFIRRGNHEVRWDEDNCRPQCRDCNEGHAGREDVFEEELRDELGEEGFYALIERSKRSKYLTDEDISTKLTYYSACVDKMGKTQ